MKKTALLIICNSMLLASFAQSVDRSTRDVKLGLGLSHLGTGDILIYKAEGEFTNKGNKIISNSVLLGVGYGDVGPRYYRVALDNNGNYITEKRIINPSFTTHIDGNVFVSPFGNHRVYNLKLGIGISLMYVSVHRGTYSYPAVERRVSLGYNAIVEQEVTVSKQYLLGLKTMVQPYLNGDINLSLMLKIGKKIQ